MSKRAREFRATTRRDDRYVDGRPKPEDIDAAVFGWNKAKSRNLKKFERNAGELLMTTEEHYHWIVFGMWRPLLKGKGK